MTQSTREAITRGEPLARVATRPVIDAPALKDSAWHWRVRATPYLFLAPYFLVTLVFFIYPVIYAVQLAFYQTNGPRSQVFVGLSNFTFALTDPDFHTALANTGTYAVFSVFLQLPLALGLAMILNTRADRLKGFFRLAIFAPNLVGAVFVGILFTMLFTPQYGLFNKFLHLLYGTLTGSEVLQNRWLGEPALVMPALIIISLWMYTGFNMIYFLAALQNVDQSLVEAAKIDGAGPFQVFWNVTLPAIKPVATFVVVMATIGSFNLFELPYTLLQGYGPGNSGLTVVGYLYLHAFEGGDLGMGAAIGWLLTALILTISLIQIRISRRGED
jgi:ABC-type sugar transport system permease subunit